MKRHRKRLFNQEQSHQLIAAVSLHINGHTQSDGLFLTGPGLLWQQTASKDQTLGFDLQFKMNLEILELNTQLSLKYSKNKSRHFIPFQSEATSKVIHDSFPVFPPTSFQHVPWKNREKWKHFCEGPGRTQSQHCAQYISFSFSSRVHDSRRGCKCNALRGWLDWEIEGNVFLPHPVYLIFVDKSWCDYFGRSTVRLSKN